MGVKLDREADAAAAAGGGIGVADHELGPGQFVDEGDLGALEEGDRDRVDQGGLAVQLNAQVVGLGGVDQFKAVLEARTTAAVDGDAQHPRSALRPGQLGQPDGRAGSQHDTLGRTGGDFQLRGRRRRGLDGAHRGLYEAEAGIRKGPRSSQSRRP